MFEFKGHYTITTNMFFFKENVKTEKKSKIFNFKWINLMELIKYQGSLQFL